MASDDGMSDVLEISSDENASPHERREGDTGVAAPGEPEAEEEPEGETDPYSCYDVTTGYFAYDTHGALAAPGAEDDEFAEPVQEDAVPGAEDDELAEPVQEDAAPGAEDDELAEPVQEDAAPGAEDDELAEPVQEDPSTEYFDYDTPGAFATPGAEEEEFAVPVEEDPYGQTADEFVGLEVDPYSLPAEDSFPAENCDSLAEHEAEAAAEVEAVGAVAEEVAEESQQKVGGDTPVDQAAQDRAIRPGDSSDTAEYEEEVDWGDGDAEDEQAESQGPQSAAQGPQPKKMPCAPKAAPCRANAARNFNLVSGQALKGGIAAVLSGAPSGKPFTAFPQPLAKTAPGASQQPDGEGSTASYLAREPIFIPSAAAKATRAANQQANGLRGAAKGTIVEDLPGKPGGGVPTAAPQPPTKAAPAASQQPDRLRGAIKGSTAASAPGGSVPTAAPQPPTKPAPPASQQPDRLRGAIKGGTAASAPGGSSSAAAPQPSAKMAPAANQQPDRLRGTIKGSTAAGAPGGKEPMAAPQPSSKSARAVDQRPDREVWRPSAPRRSAPQQPLQPPPQHLMRQQPRQPPNKAAPVLKPGQRNVAVVPSQAQPTQAAKKRPALGDSDPQASSDAPALAPAARLGKQPRPSPVETSAQEESSSRSTEEVLPWLSKGKKPFVLYDRFTFPLRAPGQAPVVHNNRPLPDDPAKALPGPRREPAPVQDRRFHQAFAQLRLQDEYAFYGESWGNWRRRRHVPSADRCSYLGQSPQPPAARPTQVPVPSRAPRPSGRTSQWPSDSAPPPPHRAEASWQQEGHREDSEDPYATAAPVEDDPYSAPVEDDPYSSNAMVDDGPEAEQALSDYAELLAGAGVDGMDEAGDVGLDAAAQGPADPFAGLSPPDFHESPALGATLPRVAGAGMPAASLVPQQKMAAETLQ